MCGLLTHAVGAGPRIGRRAPVLARRDRADKRTFIIVVRPSPSRPPAMYAPHDLALAAQGGGPAGYNACEVLRSEGFRGTLILVSKEPHLPIDRVRLSKGLKVGAPTHPRTQASVCVRVCTVHVCM
jgi:hypothetical protein